MARAYFFCGLRMARSGISPGPGAGLPALGTVALTWGVRLDTLVIHRDAAHAPPSARPPRAAATPGGGHPTAPGGPRGATTDGAAGRSVWRGHAGAYRMLR